MPYSKVEQDKKPLDCDRIAHLMNALERLMSIATTAMPGISRLPEAAKLATILEIMEILDYEFEDEAAAGNALSKMWEFNAMRGIETAGR